MSRGRMIIILAVSVTCGLLASLLVLRYVRQQEARARAARLELRPVVIATADLPIGTRLTVSHVAVRAWPKDGLPQGAVAEPGEVLGRIVRGEIAHDEPILEHRLFSKDLAGAPGIMSVLVPSGKRAMAIGVNEVIGVSGFILPKDRVDVIATKTDQPTSKSAETILQNVEVLAVGKRFEQEGKQNIEVPTVTLAVTPEQAQQLALALQEGKIHVALRSVMDTQVTRLAAITRSSAIGGGAIGARALSLLQQAMKEISPQDEIGVKAVQTSVILSGTVSNPSLIARAAEVAKAFLPDKATVVNLIQLGEPHQIMLKVEVAEVNRSALRELGLDFVTIGNTFTLAFLGATGGGLLATVLDVAKNTVETDQRLSAAVRVNDTRFLLRALEQKGLVKVLARPNLIAASGASASFLVGGEFPVPVPGGGGTGTVTIQFKPFGVRLDFTPTLNDLGSINLKIMPEVSELDFENGIISGTFRIPSLRTRRASTIVDLRPGQSLAIGGLMSSEDRKSISKFPILGDIPVLGALFRSTNFTRNETDLIIFVTPEIVKPLEAAKVPNLEEQMKMTPTEEKEIRQIPQGR